jgi:hypothetical protein
MHDPVELLAKTEHELMYLEAGRKRIENSLMRDVKVGLKKLGLTPIVRGHLAVRMDSKKKN